MQSDSIFVYGTLRDADVLKAVLGPLASETTLIEGAVAGFRVARAEGGPFPGIVENAASQAIGAVLMGLSAEAVARLTYFEGAFAFDLVPVIVNTKDGGVPALIFRPQGGVELTDIDWTLEDWQATAKPLFLEMTKDIMRFYPDGGARGDGVLRMGALRRAVARMRGQDAQIPARLRSDFGEAGITGLSRHSNFIGFFSAETLRYRFRKFSGATSKEVDREVLVTGDAVSVLPWDPKRDLVLLIEQVRAGAIARGDRNPWSLEAIAGLLDRDESPEDAARREALEEADLRLGRMEQIASYYSSPGALTEHMTSFIGEADLGGVAGVHGLESEAEDIRGMILPVEEALEALATGEAANAPLVILLQALAARRDALKAAWADAER